MKHIVRKHKVQQLPDQCMHKYCTFKISDDGMIFIYCDDCDFREIHEAILEEITGEF